MERRHRDLGNGPAKALIVARSQDDARRFQETTDRLMRERGLRPIAELAVSSEMDAHQVLERFRRLSGRVSSARWTWLEGDARVTGEAGGDVAMELVRLVEPEAVKVGLPESDAPRIVVAVRTALTSRQDARPFDPVPDDQAELALALAEPSALSASPTVEPLSIERMATEYQGELSRLGRWWHVNGNTPVANFNADVNRAGGIGQGGRHNADLEKLRAATEYARRVLATYCNDHGLKRPRQGGG